MAKKPSNPPEKIQQVAALTGEKTLRGTPLNYPYAVELRYKKRIDALILQMTRTTERQLKNLFKSPVSKEYFAAQDASVASQSRILTNELKKKFQQLFDRRAKALAESMVNSANKTSASNLHGSLKNLSGLSIKTSTITAPMKEVLKASIAENVSLIRSIPQQYFTQIEGAVMRAITTGNGMENLEPFLKKHEGITLRRAKLIASDQTKKAYNNLNAGRMKAIGVNKYEWLHGGGVVEPRPLHVSYNGKIFSLDDPPVIQYAKGSQPEVRGKPGDLINCNCKMIPVVDFDTGE